MSNTFLKFNSPDLGVLPRFRCLMRLAMMRASVSGKRQWKAGNRLISRTGVENTLTIDSIDYTKDTIGFTDFLHTLQSEQGRLFCR